MNAPTHIRRTSSSRRRGLPLVVLVAAALLVACLLALVGMTNPSGVGFPGANPAEAQETSGRTLYKVQDLGTFGGDASFAFGINDSDKVVGDSSTSAAGYHAFLYSGGKMTDLGTLGGPESSANDINEADKVVGESSTSGTTENHAFLYDASATPRMRDLGTLGGSESWAFGINDSEQVVGSAATSDDSIHAFLYDASATPRMRDLGTLGGSESWAFGINNSGKVTGYAATSVPYPYHHAFLYSSEKMTDLGTLGGTESWAFDLNEADKVVGSAFISGDAENHAFLYDASATPRMRDLGTLGGSHSMAFGINDSEQVVGSAATSDDSIHAFLYSGGKMRDLNSLIPANSGWELISAEAINDKGHIVGYGTKDDLTRAFLLTPDTTAPTVTSTVPTGTTPVAPTTNVKAFFSEDMQRDSVKGAFKLFKKGSTTPLAADVFYDPVTDKATLDPENNLRRGVTYKAVVTTGAKDLAGNRLDQDPSLDGPQQMKWFFTVKR